MEIAINLLFWLHLMALALAGAAIFGLPVVGGQMASAGGETRAILFTIAKRLSTFSRAALGVLIVTGPLLVWLKYGGMAGFTPWFHAKMTLVVLLLVSVIVAGILLKRAQGGDSGAAEMLPRLSLVNLVLVLGIVLCAVFAFG